MLSGRPASRPPAKNPFTIGLLADGPPGRLPDLVVGGQPAQLLAAAVMAADAQRLEAVAVVYFSVQQIADFGAVDALPHAHLLRQPSGCVAQGYSRPSLLRCCCPCPSGGSRR